MDQQRVILMIFIVGEVIIFLATASGMYLNLSHQAAALADLHPSFKAADDAAWYANPGLAMAIVIDGFMIGAEIFAIGYTLLLSMKSVKVPTAKAALAKWEQEQDAIKKDRKVAIMLFLGTGATSITLVTFSFLSHASGGWFQQLIGVLVGLALPSMIVVATGVQSMVLKWVLSLLDQKKPARRSSSSAKADADGTTKRKSSTRSRKKVTLKEAA